MQISEDRFTIEGGVEIAYEDFGLKPPSVGLFVSRAHETLWVGGRLILKRIPNAQ